MIHAPRPAYRVVLLECLCLSLCGLVLCLNSLNNLASVSLCLCANMCGAFPLEYEALSARHPNNPPGFEF